jgi:hypothetical protein
MALGLAAALAGGCYWRQGGAGELGETVSGTSGNSLLNRLLDGPERDYLLGAHSDRIVDRDHASAAIAVQNVQTNPATASQATYASTFDLNADEFVTLDEVLAMQAAELTDEQRLLRLRTTDQVFELTPEQELTLRARGLSENFITEMKRHNAETRSRLRNEPLEAVIPTPSPPLP